MYNSSVDFVVKSILKSPLVNLNGLLYQKYDSFFGQEFLEKLDLDEADIKCEALEQHDTDIRIFRNRVSYTERISKELNIFFQNKKIVVTNSNQADYQCSNIAGYVPSESGFVYEFIGVNCDGYIWLDPKSVKLAG